jgi:transcriptional regulator with XRE-family HTH domain
MSERVDFFIKGKELLAKPFHYTASGLKDIYLLNGVTEEVTDYGKMVHIKNINGLHRAIGLHIIEKDEPMNGAEFRFLRKEMGLTQAELGESLQVSDQTIANYEKGNTAIGPAESSVRAAYLLFILPEETRIAVLKSLLPPAQKKRKRLPDVPRRKLVEHWVEEGPLHAA